MAFTIIRTDLLSGTKQFADLVSIRFYDGNGKEAEVENGTIVKLQGYEAGEREVMKAVAATASDDMEECAIVAGVEMMYDERKVNLDEFINEAGVATRAYIPRSRNMFSVTAEGFVGGTVPAVDGKVGVGTAGKLDAAGTGFGECVAIEVAGRYTYYVIKIAPVAPVAASAGSGSNS